MRDGGEGLFSEIEWFLNFGVLQKQLDVLLKNKEHVLERVLIRLDSFREISALHNFLIETAKYMSASPSDKLQKGNVTDLFFRMIGIKLAYMEFEDIRDCYFNFQQYLDGTVDDSMDTFAFLDHNQVFSFSKMVRESLENVKKGNMNPLFDRINDLNIDVKFKTDLQEVLRGSRNEYVR